MEEIRQDFHDLANKLNNISVGGGSVVEIAKLDDIDKMTPEEIKKQLKKALDTLSNAVNSALEAGEILSKLRKKVYKDLNIDTSKPIK